MSVSVIKSKGIHTRHALAFAAASLFCAIFAAVYESFSHGVVSLFMVLMFLIPLIPGAGVHLILSAKHLLLSRPARNLYNAGIAALTVGSCLEGVLEIYGTSSDIVLVYPAAGVLLIIAAVICAVSARGGISAENNQ